MSGPMLTNPTPIPVEASELVRARARRRTRGLGLLFALGLSVIGIRGVQLCLDPDSQITSRASVQRWGEFTIRERRGDVVDREGRRLATSLDTPSIVADPVMIKAEDRAGLARDLARILEMPESRIRVIKPRVGGGFGDKQEMVMEDLVAVLAVRTGRPVRLEFTRAEELTAARYRHPGVRLSCLPAEKHQPPVGLQGLAQVAERGHRVSEEHDAKPREDQIVIWRVAGRRCIQHG